MHIIGRLEREVEEAVVDMFDGADAGAGAGGDTHASTPSSSAPTLAVATSDSPKSEAEAPREPGLVLNETQRKLVTWLNTLPGLKKELAFIDPVRNAHGTIIARDVKRFPSHKIGEGVLRHWADHFII